MKKEQLIMEFCKGYIVQFGIIVDWNDVKIINRVINQELKKEQEDK